MGSHNHLGGKAMTLVLAILLTTVTLMGTTVISIPAAAQQSVGPNPDELRAGKNFLETKVYTEQQDQETLALFEGLRVADVSDGMDKVGLANVGLMSPEIQSSWKDTKHYKHRFIGIAVTVRYVPTNRGFAPAMESEAFDKWVGKTYNEVTPEPFVPLIRKGTAVVFDDAPDSDVGSIGSNNIMGWKLRGCVGVVTERHRPRHGRDRHRGNAAVFPPSGPRHPSRPQRDRVGEPPHRVRRRPGPAGRRDRRRRRRRHRGAPRKGQRSRRIRQDIMEGDKEGRRGLYKQLGLPDDDSVK